MIPMRPEFNALRFEVGDARVIERMPDLPVEEPFSPGRIAFLNDVSHILLADKEAKAYPDVITLAFWIRKANMERKKQSFLRNDVMRLGRGVVFHIAPSNVAVNYAYSFAASFILGNSNLVRLPSRDFSQVRIINRAICGALKERSEYQNFMAFFRYEKSREVNDALSSISNVRVVWGGDTTIHELRRSPLPPRAEEITFADRYSICIVDVDAYLKRTDADKIAVDFYNDTYLSDQNACTTPRLVCWLGDKDAAVKAREQFWRLLNEVVSQKYTFQSIQFVDKLANCCLAAADLDGIHVAPMGDNQITRVEIEKIVPNIRNYQGNSGFFYEYHLRDILELAPLCDEKLQTVSLLGNREVVTPLLRSGVKGIDRVVEIGHTLDFNFLWDGYDLKERLTRCVVML